MYNFFKVFLRSTDKSARGTTADFTVPVRLSSGGLIVSGSWHVAVKASFSLLHTGFGFARGLVLFNDTFHDTYSGSSVIAHIGRSFRIDEENY